MQRARGQELAARDLGAAARRALRAPRRLLRPRRRVRLGRARGRQLRAADRAERRPRRLDRRGRPVRAAARPEGPADRRDLGGRAGRPAGGRPTTRSTRSWRSRATPRWRCGWRRTRPTTSSTSGCSRASSRCRRALAEADDAEEILQAVCDGIRDALGFDKVVIELARAPRHAARAGGVERLVRRDAREQRDHARRARAAPHRRVRGRRLLPGADRGRRRAPGRPARSTTARSCTAAGRTPGRATG